MGDLFAREPELMDAISLWQPYASLIFAGSKLHETRHWKYPERLHGKTIAIHAAQKMLPASLMSPELLALCIEEFGADFRGTLPRGVVLGTARLSGCAPTEAHLTIDAWNRAAGDWGPNRFAWALTHITALAAPVAERGGQGWWKVDPTTVRRPTPPTGER